MGGLDDLTNKLLDVMWGMKKKRVESKQVHIGNDMGVEPKMGGKPPKWMVKIMENPIF